MRTNRSLSIMKVWAKSSLNTFRVSSINFSFCQFMLIVSADEPRNIVMIIPGSLADACFEKVKAYESALNIAKTKNLKVM